MQLSIPDNIATSNNPNFLLYPYTLVLINYVLG